MMGARGAGGGGGPEDPVSNYQRWKKKSGKRKEQSKQLRRQRKKKPGWQQERDDIARMVQKYSEINSSKITTFFDFPISKKTSKGLVQAQYRMPTEIQKQAIGLALQGKDILGAAKTGSGKTLAFLIPILECLYRQQWTSDDGMGALIISPTRELAYQTFETLRKVGKNHDFSAGLIIGGKFLDVESDRIHRTNIIICTPGRLLQHMDETCYFHASDLQMLVLDEADRILDMGFAQTMNAIVENLPKKRQTLLFSATQTKCVKDLARLSLKDPEYVSVHENAKFSTPGTLEQNYIVCELHQKVNMLYSFLKNHLSKKIIVFFSSCKEIQYLFRAFCRLRPGVPVLLLHGKQQQMKRMQMYDDFCRKKAAVLFATDIAARGLDFPAVNWVLQLDCPEDANTYIHRAGRTARYKEGGEALLVLLPSEEEGMVKQLEEKKVPINKIEINPGKLTNVQPKLQSFLAEEQELKERAQRCFVSYMRSVYLMKNKDVFNVFALPLKEYALSLGLAVLPRIRFLQKAQQEKEMAPSAQIKPSATKDTEVESSEEDVHELESFKCQLRDYGSSSQIKAGSKAAKKGIQDNHENSTDEDGDSNDCEETVEKNEVAFSGQFFDDDDDDDDDKGDLLTVKRRNVFALESDCKVECEKEEMQKAKTKPVPKNPKIKEAKKILRKKLIVNTKVTFDEAGKMVQLWPPVQKSKTNDDQDDDSGGLNVEKAIERLREEDKYDKEAYRKKVKEKHKERRLKEKAKKVSRKIEEREEEPIAYLDQSEGEEEFDPRDLPDPDKYRASEETDDNNISDAEENGRPAEVKLKRKRNYSSSSIGESEEMLTAQKRKKRTKDGIYSDEEYKPLDTGLSLVEDEELVLHLLSNKS
ncbi:probable ATP-dependent RNA helicase DDX10 isoform X2 [Callorhinchus milii]|uniref:probable ATP-dependent RNA helicase DDX10 isoform X2 n=1 Tax=Callorhinchus milii TaxID=7868 RepID=UPI001C3F93C7|nr:probable ATP-dependent RNA helicase DDX10 isoform X2 [Callorhinchus milii]